MAANEFTGLQKYKDKNGNIYIIYPVTKDEAVDLSDEAIAALGISGDTAEDAFRSVISHGTQSLTNEQKARARANIGAGTSSLTLGETSATAYQGDRGKTAYDHSQATHARTDATKTEKSNTNGNVKINGTETVVYTHPSGTNPHGTTKSDVGLGNVGNFKAVSTSASQGLTDTEKANARANIGALSTVGNAASASKLAAAVRVGDTTGMSNKYAKIAVMTNPAQNNAGIWGGNTIKLFVADAANGNLNSEIYIHARASGTVGEYVFTPTLRVNSLKYGKSMFFLMYTGWTVELWCKCPSTDVCNVEIFEECSDDSVFFPIEYVKPLSWQTDAPTSGTRVNAIDAFINYAPKDTVKALYSSTDGASSVTLSDTPSNYDYLILTIKYDGFSTCHVIPGDQEKSRFTLALNPYPASGGTSSVQLCTVMSVVDNTNKTITLTASTKRLNAASSVSAADWTPSLPIVKVVGIKKS